MRYQDRLMHGPTEGMGGYLDPPNYPTHTYSVHSGPKANPHSIMSLPSAAQADYLDPVIRAQAQALIDAWHANRPTLDSEQVQVWIANRQRHWASCWYSATPDAYGCHAGSPYWKGAPRAEDAQDYATYHIQKFYPEYQP